MAVYTIELGDLLKTGYDIGLDAYPVPSYLDSVVAQAAFRNKLNAKIINHYYFMEIGSLPPDRFKHFLNMTMCEIMPIKNLLYDALAENWKFYTGGTLTELITDNKDDVTNKKQSRDDIFNRETGSNSNEQSNDTTQRTGNDKLEHTGVDTVGNITNNRGSATNYKLDVASDTPGQMLNIETDIANNTYASSAVKTKTNDSTTANNTSTDTTTYNSSETTTHNTIDTLIHTSSEASSATVKDSSSSKTNDDSTSNSKYNRNRTVTGISNKSYSELFKEYQEALRNIDMEVIDSLATCFMSIF